MGSDVNLGNLTLNLTYAGILLKNEKFGLDFVSKMFKIASIKEVKTPLKVINTHSVSENLTSKKRLVFDLRYIY